MRVRVHHTQPLPPSAPRRLRLVGPVTRPRQTGDATDTQLVAACLNGDERAWERLIDRYKRLIYSVPLKFGATPDVAADVFQAVCVDLVAELPRLRNPEALKGWLVRVAQHKSLKWKQQSRRQSGWLAADDEATGLADDAPNAAQVLDEVEREQTVRAAVERLPERARQLVTLLFFTTPPMPYAEVARRLGLATGSIGFIRGRCLKKLEAALRAQGL